MFSLLLIHKLDTLFSSLLIPNPPCWFCCKTCSIFRINLGSLLIYDNNMFSLLLIHKFDTFFLLLLNPQSTLLIGLDCFRIKQCTDITEEYLLITHHEMGHIQYDLQYMHQPVIYRDGANPGWYQTNNHTDMLLHISCLYIGSSRFYSGWHWLQYVVWWSITYSS